MLTNAPIDPNRVAVYIRWSTDEQTQGTTLEVQREACQHFLKSQGWNYTEELVFVDDGYSGGNMDRPALARLRVAVNAGDVVAVVVYKLDRLSRNLLDCVNLVRQEWAGVAMFSTMERFDTHSSVGQMVFNILVSFAEFERNVIRDRMMSGKRKRWEQGRNSGFKYPYGYRRSATGGFEIDPAQAEVVRRMYDDYIQGAGFAVIRDRLNQEGIPAPSGGQWRICSIQLILKNPFYAGHMAAGYYSYEGGKQRRGKAPTRLLEDAVPAIIQQSVFDRVQSIRAGKLQAAPSPNRYSDYILSTILRCASCGGPMAGHNGAGGKRRRYYRCINGKEFGGCECGAVPKEDVEQAVLAAVRERFSPQHLRLQLEEMDQRRLDEIETRRAAVEQHSSRIADVGRRREKLDADYLAGDLDAKQYARLSERLESDTESAERQLKAARRALAEAEQSTVDIERLNALVDKLDGLAELEPMEIRRILKELLSSVQVFRSKGKGRYNNTPIEVTIEHNVEFLTTA